MAYFQGRLKLIVLGSVVMKKAHLLQLEDFCFLEHDGTEKTLVKLCQV